ncbi:MAG: hypothetical protein V8S98_03020 [Lachnospiraceae bacterium]
MKLSEFARKINQSITRKILCLIVMSIGASFLVSLFVIKKIENSYSNYVYETKTDLLNSSMAGIEDKMLVYENSTYQFITSSQVQQFVSQLREAYETNRSGGGGHGPQGGPGRCPGHTGKEKPGGADAHGQSG